MGVWYCLRESVKLAVDVKDSARANAQIDRIIGDVSETIERQCRRVFYPRIMTQTWDWPHSDRPTAGRLWLGGHSEVNEIYEMSSGGVDIDVDTLKLYPSYGPPYTRIELDRSGAASFGGGSTFQQDISIRAEFAGAPVVEKTRATTTEALDDSETEIDVSSVDLLGVGALLRCGDERMVVTEMAALDTGVNTAAGITANMNDVVVTLSTTTGAPRPKEIITIDAESMLVTRVIGTSMHVRRAYDGTTAATHLSGADIYADRTLTVERGVYGTTAATHLSGVAVKRWMPPGGVEGLAIAETLNQLEQEKSAYARVIGSGEGASEQRGQGLKDKRKAVRQAWGRRVRMGAV